MRRTVIGIALMTTLLTSCAATSSSGAGGPGGGGDPGEGSTSVVSGRIVRADTGAPYPRAWVRFYWLVNAVEARETHTYTDADGHFAIQLAEGSYQVSAGDDCDLAATFTITGRAQDDDMITVPGTSTIDLVESPVSPGATIPSTC